MIKSRLQKRLESGFISKNVRNLITKILKDKTSDIIPNKKCKSDIKRCEDCDRSSD